MSEEDSYPEEMKYYAIQAEKTKRLIVVTIVMPLIVGLPVLFYSNLLPSDYYTKKQLFNIAGGILIVIALVSIVMTYLQTGFKKTSISQVELIKKEGLYDNFSITNRTHQEYVLKKISKLESELSKLSILEKNNSSINNAITAEEKEKLVVLLQNELLRSASEGAAISIMNNLQKKFTSSKKRLEINELFSRTLERLNKEIDSLTRRGNLNLTLGILTTVIGLCLLGFFVISAKVTSQDNFEFIIGFIPRLSLVVLIEVFAYFFLKLYKSSLSEIKYFQNEMTNIEGKYAAIKCAERIEDTTILSSVINNLAKTERNALIEKGQTTTEIEMAKLENKKLSNFADNFLKAFELNKKE